MPDDGIAGHAKKSRLYEPKFPIRFVTAASLFDGHDASINIMRRILQSAGAEVIHLGHNRSVDEVVTAAIQEDAQGIAVSSYQGGHVEYFKYMVDLLTERGRPDIKVFGGGGGVIVAPEIKNLHDYGISRIYSPHDGQFMGLPGMIHDMLERADRDLGEGLPTDLTGLEASDHAVLARIISGLELGRLSDNLLDGLRAATEAKTDVPVVGITGTGGAGKSSLTDELIRRFRLYSDEPKIAVIAVDPTRRKTKGALLGDRIRMNAINPENTYMRSLATRASQSEVPPATPEIIAACKAAGFDLVIVETPGIGQGDAAIVEHVDVSLYVMTPEFGAQSQLEKIDMLDFADIVAINKLDRKGALDALRDVRKQVQRNREAFGSSPDDMPVFGCMASKFADPGVTALYQELLSVFAEKGFNMGAGDHRSFRVRCACSCGVRGRCGPCRGGDGEGRRAGGEAREREEEDGSGEGAARVVEGAGRRGGQSGEGGERESGGGGESAEGTGGGVETRTRSRGESGGGEARAPRVGAGGEASREVVVAAREGASSLRARRRAHRRVRVASERQGHSPS